MECCCGCMEMLLRQQQELLDLMKAIDTKLDLPDPLPEEEVWLTKAAVMDMLCITVSTFYRRQQNWKRRKSGGTWYYLKSSLL
ncbi:hypothetical protein HDC92_002505 [Pedobacter sp. AK017]|uniref:hypothetical protein n=1 Tax=Pedobacter sp. AK017 TaxID=2723073 RepID=UPI0016177CD9|nr:hypothetical protein [Pedobacter sp. AK017]MBB5438824.1 hypothetical protein [Pedobacter sp. AK017]